MWEKILKRGKIPKRAKQLIDEVMDSEPRTLTEILDRIFDNVEEKRKEKTYRGGMNYIPTRSGLMFYLGKHYNSGVFDIHTNRQLKDNKKRPHNERRYWK